MFNNPLNTLTAQKSNGPQSRGGDGSWEVQTSGVGRSAAVYCNIKPIFSSPRTDSSYTSIFFPVSSSYSISCLLIYSMARVSEVLYCTVRSETQYSSQLLHLEEVESQTPSTYIGLRCSIKILSGNLCSSSFTHSMPDSRCFNAARAYSSFLVNLERIKRGH